MKFFFSKDARKIVLGGVPVVGNVFTGGFILLSQEGNTLFDEILEGKEVYKEDLSDNLIDLLDVAVEEQILTTEELPESKPHIASAYLHVTHYCNLHCVGCYSDDERRNQCKDLSLLQIKQIIDVLHEQQLHTLLISGGEPFIRDDIVEILKYAKAKIPQVVVGTNGTRITEEVARSIKGLVDNVSLSIDGYAIDKADYIRDKGTFPKVLDAAKHLWGAGVPFSLLPTIHRKNFRDIGSFLELAEKINAPIAFSLLTCNTYEKSLEDFVLSEQDFLEFIKQNSGNDSVHVNESSINMDDLSFRSSCGAGKNTISIDARGCVYLCHMLHTEEFYMGNILVDSWDSIFTNIRKQKLTTHDVDKIDECMNCEYKFFCGGGCKARTIYAKGTLNASDIYCNGLKENFRVIANFFAELAKNNI